MTDYYGLPTRTIENDHLLVEYLAHDGLRLVRLIVKNSASRDNLLAETPHSSWQTAHGEYFLRGGHRLWHAPEAMPRSYVPDGGGLDVKTLPDGVWLGQSTEAPTGIRKSMEVRLSPGRPALRVKHVLRNEGLWLVELAPWAITQVALGGVAVLPQAAGPIDAAGLLPNRQFALWSYTQTSDKRLELHDDFCLVHGRPQLPPCKIGYQNRQGWAGYLRQDVFFVKRFAPQAELPHPDFGCNVEVYVNDLSLELETIGPLKCLAPGQSVAHVEQWEFFTGVQAGPTLDEIRALANTLAPQPLELAGPEE